MRPWAFFLALALAQPGAAADAPTARPLDSEPVPAPGREEPARTLPPTVAVCHDGSRCWTRPLAEDCAADGGRVFRVVLGDARGRDATTALAQCRVATAAPPRDLPQPPGAQSH